MRIFEFYNSRLDFIVNTIRQVEDYYSTILDETLDMKLNPDDTSSEDDNGVYNNLYSATIGMLGNHYAVNNASEIANHIKYLLKNLPK